MGSTSSAPSHPEVDVRPPVEIASVHPSVALSNGNEHSRNKQQNVDNSSSSSSSSSSRATPSPLPSSGGSFASTSSYSAHTSTSTCTGSGTDPKDASASAMNEDDSPIITTATAASTTAAETEANELKPVCTNTINPPRASGEGTTTATTAVVPGTKMDLHLDLNLSKQTIIRKVTRGTPTSSSEPEQEQDPSSLQSDISENRIGKRRRGEDDAMNVNEKSDNDDEEVHEDEKEENGILSRRRSSTTMGGPGSKCYDVEIFAPVTKKAKIEVKEEEENDDNGENDEEMKIETDVEEKKEEQNETSPSFSTTKSKSRSKRKGANADASSTRPRLSRRAKGKDVEHYSPTIERKKRNRRKKSIDDEEEAEDSDEEENEESTSPITRRGARRRHNTRQRGAGRPSKNNRKRRHSITETTASTRKNPTRSSSRTRISGRGRHLKRSALGRFAKKQLSDDDDSSQQQQQEEVVSLSSSSEEEQETEQLMNDFPCSRRGRGRAGRGGANRRRSRTGTGSEETVIDKNVESPTYQESEGGQQDKVEAQEENNIMEEGEENVLSPPNRKMPSLSPPGRPEQMKSLSQNQQSPLSEIDENDSAPEGRSGHFRSDSSASASASATSDSNANGKKKRVRSRTRSRSGSLLLQPHERTQDNWQTELLLDLLRKVRRKTDAYGFFAKPVDPHLDECPDYYDIVDINEAMCFDVMQNMIVAGGVSSASESSPALPQSSVESSSEHSRLSSTPTTALESITTLEEFVVCLKRIIKCARAYNTDEENFVRMQADQIWERSEDYISSARQKWEENISFIKEKDTPSRMEKERKEKEEAARAEAELKAVAASVRAKGRGRDGRRRRESPSRTRSNSISREEESNADHTRRSRRLKTKSESPSKDAQEERISNRPSRQTRKRNVKYDIDDDSVETCPDDLLPQNGNDSDVECNGPIIGMEIPFCKPQLADSIMTPCNKREDWLELCPKLATVCNEAARRSTLRACPGARRYEKPLSETYIKERLEYDSPLDGFYVTTEEEPHHIQGFIVATCFTTWRKTFRWTMDAPAALITPSDHRLHATDVDGSLTKELQEAKREASESEQEFKFPRICEISLVGGLGCGSAMLSRTLSELRQSNKYDFVALQSTKIAIPFYEKHGFVRVGATMKFKDVETLPDVAYRHWSDIFDGEAVEPSYMMALRLQPGDKPIPRPLKKDSELSEEEKISETLSALKSVYSLLEDALKVRLGSASYTNSFREVLSAAREFAISANDFQLVKLIDESKSEFTGTHFGKSKNLLRKELRHARVSKEDIDDMEETYKTFGAEGDDRPEGGIESACCDQEHPAEDENVILANAANTEVNVQLISDGTVIADDLAADVPNKFLQQENTTEVKIILSEIAESDEEEDEYEDDEEEKEHTDAEEQERVDAEEKEQVDTEDDQSDEVKDKDQSDKVKAEGQSDRLNEEDQSAKVKEEDCEDVESAESNRLVARLPADVKSSPDIIEASNLALVNLISFVCKSAENQVKGALLKKGKGMVTLDKIELGGEIMLKINTLDGSPLWVEATVLKSCKIHKQVPHYNGKNGFIVEWINNGRPKKERKALDKRNRGVGKQWCTMDDWNSFAVLPLDILDALLIGSPINFPSVNGHAVFGTVTKRLGRGLYDDPKWKVELGKSARKNVKSTAYGCEYLTAGALREVVHFTDKCMVNIRKLLLEKAESMKKESPEEGDEEVKQTPKKTFIRSADGWAKYRLRAFNLLQVSEDEKAKRRKSIDKLDDAIIHLSTGVNSVNNGDPVIVQDQQTPKGDHSSQDPELNQSGDTNPNQFKDTEPDEHKSKKRKISSITLNDNSEDKDDSVEKRTDRDPPKRRLRSSSTREKFAPLQQVPVVRRSTRNRMEDTLKVKVPC